MKKGTLCAAAVSASFAVASFAAGVSVDKANHTVRFTAIAAGHDTDTDIEFLFAAPSSDHEYEALFLTESPLSEIAKAMDEAGIPRGKDFDRFAWRLWPVGEAIEMSPAFTNLLRETRGDPTPPAVYTGGTRDASGKPVAETETPGAMFALYNCPQSMFQLDDSLGQSETYGRFRPAKRFEKGKKVEIALSWNGRPTHDNVTLRLEPGKLADAINTLKEKSSAAELDVLCDFSPSMTLAEAANVSAALATLDSPGVKFNGAPANQLYFRAYVPLEKWRDRRERLAQPPEVHFLADGSFKVCEIHEDWSDEESIDPKLSVTEHPCATLADAASLASSIGAKTYTIFVFAPPETRLEKIFSLRSMVKGEILNWYVFCEQ
ncbi:MAG: hypothetical protein K6F50_07775 [Kiritimatiellae bacterium]|nr:hypothetical protein [Kiritimatiellia bacterium]